MGARMCKDTAGVGRDVSAAAEDRGGATRAAPTLLGCSNEATLPGHCIPAEEEVWAGNPEVKLLPQHWFLWKEPARSQPAVASGTPREHVLLEKFIRSSDKLQ